MDNATIALIVTQSLSVIAIIVCEILGVPPSSMVMQALGALKPSAVPAASPVTTNRT